MPDVPRLFIDGVGTTRLIGVEFSALPDNDERFKDVKPFHAVGNGRKFFVRESEWLRIKEALKKVTAQ